MSRILVILLVLFLFTKDTYAAIACLTGFETGTLTESNTTSGTLSIVTTPVRTGVYALRTNPTTTATGLYQLRGCSSAAGSASDSSLALATIYVEFYFRVATLPSADDEPIFLSETSVAADKFELRINSSGNLVAYDSAAASLGTSATALATGTWYRIGVKVGTAAGSAAAYDVQINGASEISGTGTLLNTNNGQLQFGKSADRNGETVDFFFDDVIVADSSFVGAGAIELMAPDGDGTYTAFTIGAGGGADWTNVEEVPFDSDTTYLLSTGSAGDASSVTLESTSSAGISGTINGVRVEIVLARNGGANGILQLRARNGSTDVDSANVNSLSAYGFRTVILATDPNGGGAWTTSGLDTLELGAEENDTDLTKLTALYAQVHFTAAAGATTPPKIRRIMVTQ